MRLIKDPVQASDRPAVEHEPFGWIDEAEAYGESYHDTEEDLPSSEEGKEQAWPPWGARLLSSRFLFLVITIVDPHVDVEFLRITLDDFSHLFRSLYSGNCDLYGIYKN